MNVAAVQVKQNEIFCLFIWCYLWAHFHLCVTNFNELCISRPEARKFVIGEQDDFRGPVRSLSSVKVKSRWEKGKVPPRMLTARQNGFQDRDQSGCPYLEGRQNADSQEISSCREGAPKELLTWAPLNQNREAKHVIDEADGSSVWFQKQHS